MSYYLSIYTSRIVLNSNIYLYNALSDQLMTLSKEVDELIGCYNTNLISIKDIHPSLFDTLILGGFITNDDNDEWIKVLSKWEEEDNYAAKFTMTINPTLDCNMRCWYCYEQHNQSAYMTAKTMHSIQKFIENKVYLPELKGLNIDFFGGEPLLCYENRIKPILEKAYKGCMDQNKMLYVSFTTNGYLLVPSIVDELKKYAKWGKIRVQITLDGNESLHNKVKSSEGIHQTYKRTVSNIHYCVKQNIKVLVRLNYTKDNVDSFYDVIDEFESLTLEERHNITFTMHKVWQELNTNDLETRAEKLREAFVEAGFSVDDREPLTGTRCYADRKNFIVINYNGDLYKCTARAFTPALREGVLTYEGKIEWNERFRKRMELNKCSDICHKCNIFPICHAGCTQSKIEKKVSDDICPFKYSDKQKTRLLEQKIERRIKMLH